jgi:adenosylcobyric acid synthase
MMCPALMVQGTASSVGKSLLVTALCRYFQQQGLRVAPFKSQNMALNSAVTPTGGEIGRAQAVQAEAAGVEPTVEMNPVLLKPEGESRSQVVVLGRPLGSMSAAEYHAYKPELRRVIAECLEALRARYDLLVIEGAGSPAEVNLRDRDIVNMHVARAVDARVLLVGDIDRGGVFAAFVGTLELLEPEDRARVAGFVINKFRGDVGLLAPGLDFLRARTGLPTLGVLPYLPRLHVADEDSLALDDRRRRARPGGDVLDVAVVRLPRISNHDDFQPLEHEPGVSLRFIDGPDDLSSADLAVLPGSKCTVSDLAWLRATGLADVLVARARRGAPVLGVCGGCQMLGVVIEDPHEVESPHAQVEGLGLLPLRTRFAREKTTAQVVARIGRAAFLGDPARDREVVRGYEIHMGAVEPVGSAAPAFYILARNGRETSAVDGAVSDDGTVVGTMVHGLFTNDTVRDALVTTLRARRGLPPLADRAAAPPHEAEYDRLADTVRAYLDVNALARLARLTQEPSP